MLLIQGTGALDMNGTVRGFVYKVSALSPKPLWQIAQYLSERGFAVLRYDKRGVGANHLDTNVWGNTTENDLIHDAEKALNVLVQQPEVDPKRISIIGHSEGTAIAPRVAIDNSTKVKNIVLMGVVVSPRAIGDYQRDLPLVYATQVLDKNHTGFISIKQIAKDPVLLALAKYIPNANGYVSIDRQLRPFFIKAFENKHSSHSSQVARF